jgi:hypothetical protein
MAAPVLPYGCVNWALSRAEQRINIFKEKLTVASCVLRLQAFLFCVTVWFTVLYSATIWRSS